MYEPLKYGRRKVIVDTDIGPDCDDVGALAVLHVLAEKYGVEIEGILNCTSNVYGCGAIKAVNKYFGRPDIPIGITEAEGFLDGEDSKAYNVCLTEKFAPEYMDQSMEIPKSTQMYRKLLGKAEDKSIVLVTIGPLNNIAALIESIADEYSELNGEDLLSAKVYALIVMAGSTQNKQREFNIVCDTEAAYQVLTRVKVPMYFSGVELGLNLMSGPGETMPNNAQQNPLYIAYKLYEEKLRHRGHNKNASFDLTCVHFAFEGECEYYKLSSRGQMKVYKDENGETEFIEATNTDFTEATNTEFNHYYMKLNCAPEKVEQFFDKCIQTIKP